LEVFELNASLHSVSGLSALRKLRDSPGMAQGFDLRKLQWATSFCLAV
jgi:hypothetical protein